MRIVNAIRGAAAWMPAVARPGRVARVAARLAVPASVWRPPLSIAIAGYCLTFIAVIWVFVIAHVESDRRTTITNAITQNSNLAAAFEEQTLRTLKHIEAVARFVEHEYARRGDKIDLGKYIEDGVVDGKLISRLSLVDPHGDVVACGISGALKGGAGRDRCSIPLAAVGAGLSIGKPVFNRTSGAWEIPMLRAVHANDALAGGAVAMAVNPAYFTSFYQLTDAAARGVAMLLGTDGAPRAVRTGYGSSASQGMADSAVLRQQAQGPVGDIVIHDELRELRQFASYRVLPDYPLMVVVATGQDEVLAAYSERKRNAYSLALLMSGCIVMLGIALIAAVARRSRSADGVAWGAARFWSAVQSSAASLAERRHAAANDTALAAGAELQRAVFEDAAAAIAHSGLDGRFLAANRKFCELVGYEVEELRGLPSGALVHPDDGNDDYGEQRLFAGETAEHCSERRIMRKDGTWLWTRCSASLVRDAAGLPQYFMRVMVDITERKQLERELIHAAHHDSLTQLPNRALFYRRLDDALAQAQRKNWRVVVMYIDLDRFKLINDTRGHTVGDQLLRQVAGRLSQFTGAGNTVGRVGGDEFAVVLLDVAPGAHAPALAARIIQTLAEPFNFADQEIYITASMGIAVYPGDGDQADMLIKNADVAMYRAKQQGKNTFQFYASTMSERVSEKLQLESSLRHALQRAEFALHFQPKAHLATGEITGFEALLRWQHCGAPVPPAEFIPLLEDSGLIVPVGAWVLRTACAQLQAWRQAGIKPVPIAVNLSAQQFQRQDLRATVEGALHEYAIDPRLLELEITETIAMEHAQEASATLRNLKRLGVRISIDDFGTGYSSLSYLKRFPVDAVKIDRSFITELPGNADDASIAQAVITMAHTLRLTVIAEGVENDAQLDFLGAHGCDEMQGHCFSQALTAADATALLARGARLQRTAREYRRAIPLAAAKMIACR